MSGYSSRYGGYIRYMSADTAARCEELDQQTATILTEIEENNEILRGFKRLSYENRLDQVLSKCEQLEGDERHDYLQNELNVTFNMRSQNVRNRELTDILFYYSLRDEEPAHDVRDLVRRMYGEQHISTDSWYEDCCLMLIRSWGDSDVSFTQVYNRLIYPNNLSQLEYLIYKQPQLLFNKQSHHLIAHLSQHLPHDNLHQILLNTRDENEQTCMFFIVDWPTELYENKFDDLCELLSARNCNGKTVFHATTNSSLQALCANSTLNNQDKVSELLSIRDNNNKTVYDTADHRFKKQLTWLKHQYEHNNYPLFCCLRVLILYNTNHRPGAEKEAKSIYWAFQSMTEPHLVTMDKMRTKREVLELIKSTASDNGISSLIVCVMSHGHIGTIDDPEGNPITLTSIEGAMCSDSLKSKPKILIVQSCQTRAGDRRYREEAASEQFDRPPVSEFCPNIPYVPVTDHFLSVQSCREGQNSTRNVFIPYLAEQIKNSLKNDKFTDLVENVSCKMRRDGIEQTPIMISTLIGRLCIKYGYSSVVPNEIPTSVGEQTSKLQHGSSTAAAEPVTEVSHEPSVPHEHIVQIEPIPNQHQRREINEINIPAPVDTLHQEPVVNHRKTEVFTGEQAALSTISSVSGKISNSEADERSESLNHRLEGRNQLAEVFFGIKTEWPNVWREPVEITEIDLSIDLKRDEDIKLRKVLRQESEKIACMSREQHPPPTISWFGNAAPSVEKQRLELPNRFAGEPIGERPNERSVLHEQLHQEPVVNHRNTEVFTGEQAALSTTSSSIVGENPNAVEEQTSEIQNQAPTAARDPIKESRYLNIDESPNRVSLPDVMISTSDPEEFMRCHNCLEKLDCNQISTVLNLQSTHGETITHRAAEMGCLEFFELLSQLDAVTGESTSTEQPNGKLLQYINIQTHDGETVVHYAFRKGNLKIIEKICSLIPNTDSYLLTLLSHKSTSGSTLRNGTCLHTAVSNRNIETVRWIIQHIKKFPEKSCRDLLDARNKDGSTIWQLDLCREMQLILYPEFDSFYSSLLWHGKAANRALVFSNYKFDHDSELTREGARIEANRVCKSVKRLGFDVECKRKFSKGDMLKSIKKDVARYKHKCCVYWVFVMTHGKKGLILGADGKYFKIDDVLSEMGGLDTITPKVLFIQACQGDKLSTGVDVVNLDRDGVKPPLTQARFPEYGINITGVNTMVVMATLSNHTAYRDYFMKYLSEEFDAVGAEEQSLDGIIRRVRDRMCSAPEKRGNGGRADKIPQIPLTLETRTKKLLIRRTKIRDEGEDDAASGDPEN